CRGHDPADDDCCLRALYFGSGAPGKRQRKKSRDWPTAKTRDCRCPPGNQHLRMLALFLPFSCNERRQVGASASKQNKLEVIEEASKIGAYRESATTCKPLQNGSS